MYRFAAASSASSVDPGVRPSWDLVPPWLKELFQNAAGTVVAGGLVIGVIAFVIAAVMLYFARQGGYSGQGADAKARLVQVAAGVIITAGASSIVAFLAGLAG